MPELTGVNSPAYVSPAYEKMQKRWKFVRRIRNLNETIETESGTVLPKADAEGPNSYKLRVSITWGFEAVDEVIHSLVGLACRHDPELQDDVPDRIRSDWEDIDLQGTHGAIFTQHCLDAALQDGHGAILADYPKAPEGLTLAQEQALGLRAYLVLVPADRITAWRTGRVLGRFVIAMVKIREDAEVSDGAFGMKTVERYRTLYQEVDVEGRPFVSFVVHERTEENKESWGQVDQGIIRGPRWIPLHPFYGGERQGILQSLPPLRGLAYANLEHTQKKSQRAYSMYKTAIAIPIWINRVGAVGEDGQPSAVVISSDRGVDMGEGGDAKFMEGAGNALAPLREDMQDLERLMGSQGFSMLRRDQPTNQTATEKEMQATREESKLARAVRSVGDALEAAFGSMAAFYGLVDDKGNGFGGSIELRRDFSDLTLTADEMRLLSEWEDAGKITLGTFLAQVQAGGRLLQGVNIDEEEQQVRRDRADEPLDIDPMPGEELPDEGGEPLPAAA